MHNINQHIINKIKTAVLSIDENGKLIMFGSRARGDFNEQSDWDFLMLTSKNIEPVLKRRVIDKILEIELDENICVQMLLRNNLDWDNKYSVTPIYKNIQQEGIVI